MNNNFNLPKNIKQIGSIDKNLKVYIEDYAFTFMQQYSKEDKSEDKIAILVGQDCNIDGSEVIFISGVIKPKYTQISDSMLVLTDKSFDYIHEQIETYFPNLKVVGWFYSRTGFEKTITQNYIDYHKQTFFSENKVFFLNDPNESYGSFFKFDNNSQNFKELRGFIIYYERNEAMSEYMLNNKTNYNSELIEKKEKEAKLKVEEEVTKLEKQKQTLNEEQSEHTSDSKKPKVFNKSDINLKQDLTKVKKINENIKKTSNIFGTLTAVLILVCFVIGAALIQNEDRITEIETRLTKVDEAYRYLLLQVTNDSVQSVFAETPQPNNTNQQNQQTQMNQMAQTSQTSQQNQNNLQNSNDEKNQNNPINENNQNINNQANQQNQSNESKEKEQESQSTQKLEVIQHQTSYDKLQQKQQGTQIINDIVKETVNQENVNDTYIVKAGDSLEKISRQFYGTREKIVEIMEINGIDDPNKIYSGMAIKLP